MSSNLAYRPATELRSRIGEGNLSPVTLVESCLERIDELDNEINAFVTVREDGAIEDARRAERAIEEGRNLGPLHGLPVAVKDLTDVGGVRTTYGSVPYADHVPEENAVVVDRLQDAGAIVLGKTNTPEFGRKTVTTNRVAGTTANPWDPSRTVGGSSGGSAAALAAGMTPLATGSDAAGSIRVPAAACGVYGLVPDFGRVPIGSRPDAFVNVHPYTYVGPMARTVADAALLLDVLAGPHPTEPFSLPARERPYAESLRADLDGLEVAYSPDLGIFTVDSTVRSVVGDAVSAFEDAGATLSPADAVFEDWYRLHDALEVLLQDRYLGLYDGCKRDDGIDLLDRPGEVTDEVISRIESATHLEPIDVRRAERVRTGAVDAVEEVLADADLLVTPTLALPPFPKETHPSAIEGEPIDPLHGWALTWPFNLTGHPAASVPLGTTDDGLPVGVQLVGPRLGDDLVLGASAALERASGWDDSFPPETV